MSNDKLSYYLIYEVGSVLKSHELTHIHEVIILSMSEIDNMQSEKQN